MDAIDSDRVVGILDALGTDYPKDGHQAVDDRPPGDLLPPIDPSDEPTARTGARCGVRWVQVRTP
jgi:hypothetical protein